MNLFKRIVFEKYARKVKKTANAHAFLVSSIKKQWGGFGGYGGYGGGFRGFEDISFSWPSAGRCLHVISSVSEQFSIF